MGNNSRRTPVPAVEKADIKDAAVEALLEDKEIGATITGDDGVEKVLVSKEWLEFVEYRLARAERPVLTKAKDFVVEHKRPFVLAGSTVLALGTAAFVATHRDVIAEKLEETAEVVAEKTEHAANDVKQDARQARTGSRTK